MTLIKRYSIAKDISLEDFLKIKQMAMEDLFLQIVNHGIETDRPYSFVFRDDRYEYLENPFPEIENRKMAVSIEPIPQVRITYKSPEDLHFVPRKSMLAKLKNCWEYLCDNTGGYYEMTRAEDPKEK